MKRIFAFLVIALATFGLVKLTHQTLPCGNSISCLGDLSGTYQSDKISTYMGRQIASPEYVALESQTKPANSVLGESSGPKHIFVDLGTQQLRAYQGNKLALSFPISSGKWKPTPTGDFHIWVKIRNAHMEGGEGDDYYNLYNVPYTMFFYNDQVGKELGYSLHGAYWHNNFGHPMSHGCVNISPDNARLLYDFADPPTDGLTTYATDDNPGTLVTIYGTPPTD